MTSFSEPQRKDLEKLKKMEKLLLSRQTSQWLIILIQVRLVVALQMLRIFWISLD